jgi:hypothetical protein
MLKAKLPMQHNPLIFTLEDYKQENISGRSPGLRAITRPPSHGELHQSDIKWQVFSYTVAGTASEFNRIPFQSRKNGVNRKYYFKELYLKYVYYF